MESRPRHPVCLRFTLFLAPLLLTAAASAMRANFDSFAPRRAAASLSGVVVQNGAPVGGATVTEAVTGQSVETDSRGRFVLSGLPPGPSTLSVATGSSTFVVRFQSSHGGRSRGVISIGGMGVPGGSAAVLLPVVAGGHEGAEIEGVVTVNDGTTLTVNDERLGSVAVTTDANTVIRHGSTILVLADVTVGMTVHAKTAPQTNGTYLAGEILVQNEDNGGGTDGSGTESTELSGTIKSITAPDFVLTTDSGDVTIHTDSSTTFKEKGQAKTFADLAVGDDADATGVLQTDGSLNASKVTFEPPETETEDVEVQGTVKSISVPNFVVTTDSGDVTVDTDGSTQFFKNGHDAATFADIVVGGRVEADGALQTDGSVLATKVKIEKAEGDGGGD